jgi:hypothetical protein
VFLDPGARGKTYYQILVNSLGTVARVGPGGKTWKPEVRAGARVEKEQRRWLVELAIPVADLKLAPRFGLNFARERRPMEVLELSTWSPTGDSFSQPERFGLGVIEGDLPEAAMAKAELSLSASPGYSLSSAQSVELVLGLGVGAGQLQQAALSLILSGPAGGIEAEVPAPLTERLRATLAVGDLPPGTYALSARLTGVPEAPPPASVRFTRVAAPW